MASMAKNDYHKIAQEILDNAQEPDWVSEARVKMGNTYRSMPEQPTQEDMIKFILEDALDTGDFDALDELDTSGKSYEDDDFDYNALLRSVPQEKLMPIYERLREIYRNPTFMDKNGKY